MLPVRNLTAATLPAVAGYTAWRYRRAVRELDGLPAAPPRLPGSIRTVPTAWGCLSYRRIRRSGRGPTLVLVHGWGRTADSGWWPLYDRTDHDMLVVDLPGHGRSLLDERFTFSLAAESILTAMSDAAIGDAILVGHSMGGAVALTTLLWSGPERFDGFVALASSAYWVTPRQSVVVAAAPYVMGPRSPVTIRRQRRQALVDPAAASRVTWEYAVRPGRQVMLEAAVELRRFDVRRWRKLEVPPTTWVITTRDGVIDPADQRASADMFGATRVELGSEHSVIARSPGAVARILDANAEQPGATVLVAV